MGSGLTVRSVGPRFMGSCPAAVQTDGTGRAVVLVNRATFGVAPEFARRFYLAHELGHWLTGSAAEEVADAFALGLLAGSERRSLKQSVEALARLHTIPAARLRALLDRAKAYSY